MEPLKGGNYSTVGFYGVLQVGANVELVSYPLAKIDLQKQKGQQMLANFTIGAEAGI
jgi:hypothetical protein